MDFDSDKDDEPGPIYEIQVIAHDNGIPAMSSTVGVTISTENVNDEPPEIISSPTVTLTDEVHDGGEFTLTRLRANDKDGDHVNFYFTRKFKC